MYSSIVIWNSCLPLPTSLLTVVRKPWHLSIHRLRPCTVAMAEGEEGAWLWDTLKRKSMGELVKEGGTERSKG